MKKSELKKIIKEIKVEKPLSKEKLIKFLFEEHPYLLEVMVNSNSIQELISNFSSIGDFLESEFGYNDADFSKLVKYIELYYRYFKPREIYVSIFERAGINIKSPVGYKNIILEYIGDNEHIVFCHNLKNY